MDHAEAITESLKLSARQDSHLFHTFAVDAKITVARAGSRAKVNYFRSFIEEKLHIIDEAEQQAGELVVEIGLVLVDELGPRQRCEYRFQGLFCFCPRLVVLEWRDGVALISRLSRDTVWAGGTGRKSPDIHDRETLRP